MSTWVFLFPQTLNPIESLPWRRPCLALYTFSMWMPRTVTSFTRQTLGGLRFSLVLGIRLGIRLGFALSLTLSLALSACSYHPPLSQYSAANLAAKLANERCSREFGERPFKAEDFDATLNQGRWEWGTGNGSPVDGYEVEVSFSPEGKASQIVIRGRDRE